MGVSHSSSCVPFGLIHSSLRRNLDYSEGIDDINDFLRLILIKIPIEDALCAIVDNCHAYDAFEEYLIELRSKGSISLDYDLKQIVYNQIWTREILDQLSTLITEFTLSENFYSWRSAEMNDLKIFENKWKGVVASTIPDLITQENPGNTFLKDDKIYNADASIPRSWSEPLTDTVGLEEVSLELDPICEATYAALSHTETFVHKSIEFCDQAEIFSLVARNSWIPVFIAASETLPVCITVSRVTKKTPKFPLIFVNRHFEEVSGHLRGDIIGHPGTFLQTRTSLSLPTQAEKIEKLAKLHRDRNYIPVDTLICCRKSGQRFNNMVGVRHVQGPSRRDHFIITMQMATREDVGNEEMYEVIRDFLQRLPPRD